MIGVFDSGVGGLSACLTLQRLYPSLPILYVADTLHLPFGEKTEGEILTYTRRALSFFEGQGVSLCLLACGTASAIALEKCKPLFTFPLFGIIDAGVKQAVRVTKRKKLGVIATRATIKSGVYGNRIRAFLPDAEVTELGCPTLVMAAEDGREGQDVIHAALAPLAGADIDTLILGCTHFPLLKEQIGAILPHVTLIDAAEAAAEALPLNPYRNLSEGGYLQLFVTGREEEFSHRASEVMGMPLRGTRICLDGE